MVTGASGREEEMGNYLMSSEFLFGAMKTILEMVTGGGCTPL